MIQSRLGSLIETGVNILIGYGVAVGSQIILFLWFGQLSSMNLMANHKRRFKYFEVGESPPDSGVLILEQLYLNNTQRTTTYRAKYNCCGQEVQMAHKSIVYRQQRPSKTCRLCTIKVAVLAAAAARSADASRSYARARTKTDLLANYGVRPPAWPVPNPSLYHKHLLWCDHMGAQL